MAWFLVNAGIAWHSGRVVEMCFCWVMLCWRACPKPWEKTSLFLTKSQVRQCSSPPLIRTPLLPNNSVLIIGVSFGESLLNQMNMVYGYAKQCRFLFRRLPWRGFLPPSLNKRRAPLPAWIPCEKGKRHRIGPHGTCAWSWRLPRVQVEQRACSRLLWMKQEWWESATILQPINQIWCQVYYRLIVH